MTQKIALVGSGQVTAVISSLLIIHNRELEAEASKPGIEPDRQTELRDKKVEVSILGKEGSKSLEAMSQGITFSYSKGGEKTEVKIKPDELRCSSDPSELGVQDHIILATKAFSHDRSLAESLAPMRRQTLDDNLATTITIAQNGITFWLADKLRLQNPVSIRNSTDSFRNVKRHVAGCVLNLACTVGVGEDGMPDYHKYVLTTPLEKVGIPIAFIELGNGLHNISKLRSSIKNAGIDTRVDNMSIEREVLLKLQLNAAINGICTILGKKIGEVMENHEHRNVVFAIAKEFDNAFGTYAGGKGLRGSGELQKRLKNSGGHYPSMWGDFEYGNPLEVLAIYDAAIEMASSASRTTPMEFTQQISTTLKEMARLRDENPERDLKERVSSARANVKSSMFDIIDNVESFFKPSPEPSPKPSRNSSRSSSPSPKGANSESEQQYGDTPNPSVQSTDANALIPQEQANHKS